MNTVGNIKIVIWAVIFLLIQVLIMRGIDIGWGGKIYIQILFYPLFFITLPFKISNNVLLLVAFVFGLMLDLFYDSPGVHAFASVLTMFSRKYVIQILEPRGGYGVNSSPSFESMGAGWFLSYSSILFFIHVFAYFCADIFTIAYLGTIIVKAIFSFLLTYAIVLLFHYVISPFE